MSDWSRPNDRKTRLGVVLLLAALSSPGSAFGQVGNFDNVTPNPVEEAYIFTPPGFDREGEAATATGASIATLAVKVRDSSSGNPTPCRVNVIGPDGKYYQPNANRLTPFSLTGEWPDKGFGNRRGKAPIRYFGHFFYTTGEFEIDVPAGPVRIEAWRGFEHRPAFLSTLASPGATRSVELVLERTIDMARRGYFSGDSHLHLARSSDADEEIAFDLLEAEDVRFGSILCYNLDTSRYSGAMDRQDYPQRRGLGRSSERSRGDYHIISGQEYRSGHYGHLKLFLVDEMVLPGDTIDPNHVPVQGELGRKAIAEGGFAFHAHGGYALEILADYVLGTVSGVELLQFGIYRGIGLEGWYRILNCGYRFPAEGASDYPPCRKFADCRSYVQIEGTPNFTAWYRGLAAGRSFFTTGPLLELAVDDKKPGDTIERTGKEPAVVRVLAKARSEVTPITELELVVNGQVRRRLAAAPALGSAGVFEIEESIKLGESSWIAARTYSRAPSGGPDAEAHTNPIYVYLDGKAPYQTESLDWLAARLDGQIEANGKRSFPGKEAALEYFARAKRELARVRAAGGRTAAEAFAQYAR